MDALREDSQKKFKIDNFFCLDHSINLAPLQMNQQPDVESLDNIGHFHRRDNVPQTVSKEPVGNISVDDMFDKARDHAQEIVSRNKNLTEEESKTEVEVLGNMIGVIGQPGIGKTTLSKSILKQVVNERLYNASYTFYLQFRDVDYTKETDLLSFLTKSLNLPWIKNSKRRDAVLKEVSMKDNTIIIMDGFDEAIVDA